VDSAVKKLLELKAQYKELTGVDIAGGNKRDKKSGGGGEKKSGGGGGGGKGEDKKAAGAAAGDGGAAKKDGADSGREVKKITRSVSQLLFIWTSVVLFRFCVLPALEHNIS
jgi:hypothetical protein